MIMAYETEGHGLYWQVYFVDAQGVDNFIGDIETLEKVMELGRQKKTEVRLFTQEWYIQEEKEMENA